MGLRFVTSVNIAAEKNLNKTKMNKHIKRSQLIKYYDFLLMIIAFASIVIIVAEDRLSLPAEQSQKLLAVDNIIWVLFISDYLIRFALAKSKTEYIKTHMIELVAILPFHAMLKGLRTLRVFRLLRTAKIIRILRVTRIFVYFGRSHQYAKKFLQYHNFQYVLFFTIITILTGSILIMYYEKMTFSDALWWSYVTATTVGYGDLSPVSTGGRIVASLLMLTGIGFLSILTGTIASFFVSEKKEKSLRNEVAALAIKRLDNFENLSIDELKDIFNILENIKNNSKKN